MNNYKSKKNFKKKRKIIYLVIWILVIIGAMFLFALRSNSYKEFQEAKLFQSILLNASYEDLEQTEKGNWTIDGNSVYTNDDLIFVMATPHTIYSPGYVYFNVTSKNYTGDADMTIGVDTDLMRPKSIELYKLYNVSWNTSESKIVYNVTGIYTTTADCDYGNAYNTLKRNATYIDCSSWDELECASYFETSEVFCFDNYTNEGDTYTLNWYTSHTEEREWNDYTDTIQKLDYSYDGMNKWYYIKDVPVVEDREYYFRVYIDMKISTDKTGGKYSFGMKRSQDTIQEAISNDRFYYLDPWYNVSWNYAKNLTINQSFVTVEQINFPVLINITDANLSQYAQTDGDDIVFVNLSNDKLDHEIEFYNSTNGELVAWVKWQNTSQNITMYFNNSGASNQQNPAGVWDSNTKMVQHLQEGYNNATTGFYKDSTVYGNNGTLNDPDGDSDFVKGLMDGAIYFDNAEQNGNGDEIRVASSTAFDSTTGTWEFWMKTTQQMVGEYAIIMTRATQTSGSPSGIVVVLDPDEYILVQIKKVGSVEVANLNPAVAVDDGAWHHISVIFDGTNDAYLYIDGIQRDSSTPSDSWAFNSQPMWFADSADSFWETYIGTLDEIRVSNITRSASWINATYQNGINPTGFVILGDLETAPAVEDTCTYSSGNWEVDCSDNCSITSNVDLSGNNISIIGVGHFIVSANITNYKSLFINGVDSSNKCDVYSINGGFK